MLSWSKIARISATKRGSTHTACCGCGSPPAAMGAGASIGAGIIPFPIGCCGSIGSKNTNGMSAGNIGWASTDATISSAGCIPTGNCSAANCKLLACSGAFYHAIGACSFIFCSCACSYHELSRTVVHVTRLTEFGRNIASWQIHCKSLGISVCDWHRHKPAGDQLVVHFETQIAAQGDMSLTAILRIC